MKNMAFMTRSMEMKPLVKWLIVVVAIAAAGMSLWLTIEKLTGRINTLAGCGAGSGCANVLGSKWSVVLGVVPVSVFSFLLYIAVLASLWMGGVKVRWFRMLAAWMFLAAAVWFTALQLWVLHTICPYCMTMHGLGVLLGMLILSAELKREGLSRRTITSLTLAIGMVMALAAVQHFGPGPETHRVDDLTGLTAPASDDAHAVGTGRVVSFFDGKKSYRVEELPHLGDADADHVIVKYFDYTCASCRDVHGNLSEIMAKHPGKLAVIVLPVPLNRRCNPSLPQGANDHANACELAELALRVWRADPTMFAEFHQWLFEYHDQPIQAAEAVAYSLVDEGKMSAVDQSWIDAVLRQDMADYKVFVKSTPVMPKILIKGSLMIQGATKDKRTIELLLKKHLGLK
jgi:uncharacterized membrane protein